MLLIGFTSQGRASRGCVSRFIVLRFKKEWLGVERVHATEVNHSLFSFFLFFLVGGGGGGPWNSSFLHQAISFYTHHFSTSRSPIGASRSDGDGDGTYIFFRLIRHVHKLLFFFIIRQRKVWILELKTVSIGTF